MTEIEKLQTKLRDIDQLEHLTVGEARRIADLLDALRWRLIPGDELPEEEEENQLVAEDLHPDNWCVAWRNIEGQWIHDGDRGFINPVAWRPIGPGPSIET